MQRGDAVAGKRRAAQKEATRRLLLSAALQLFNEKGYSATTIDDITARAETARITFYSHFSGRSDLVRGLIDELNDKIERRDTSPHGTSERAFVEIIAEGNPDVIAGWLHSASKHWDEIRPYLRAIYQAAAVEPELETVADTWLRESMADVTEGLEKAGRFPADTRHSRGVLAIAALDYIAKNSQQENWPDGRDKALDVLTEIWTGLLAAPETPR
jgi:AcrR family transcriptional regulator